jgi:hypothetical protein
MADDAIGKTFELFSLVIFLFVALRPDWSFKILSYGKSGVHEIAPRALLIVRSLSAFCAVGMFLELATSFFKS